MNRPDLASVRWVNICAVVLIMLSVVVAVIATIRGAIPLTTTVSISVIAAAVLAYMGRE